MGKVYSETEPLALFFMYLKYLFLALLDLGIFSTYKAGLGRGIDKKYALTIL